MRQPGPYADSTGNPMMAAQMLHSAQRLQYNSGMNQFPGRLDSFRQEEDHQYVSPKSDGQWQGDRDGSRGSNSLSRAYKEDLKVSNREQDMDLRFNDNSLPQTLEALEQRFFDDLTKLTKEQQDAEDAENARHRERLTEINTQYQEKLLTMRSRQAADRDEFLRQESQARHLEYQQVNLNSYQTAAAPGEFHGYVMPGSDAGLPGESHRAYPNNQANSYRDRPQFSGAARDRGFDSRGPYPGGRAYNTGGRRF